MMKTPKFWHSTPGALAYALSPLGWLYGKATAQRVKRDGFKADCPVICVGNLNAGGTGKTPTTIALVERLTARGAQPFVVSRGFGGSIEAAIRVQPGKHSAAEVGDEPLLMAAFGPVIVAKDRAAGVKLAQEQGATVIVMDDGFQSPAVQKDISIITVNAHLGFGNGFCIPAGPLREPVAEGLKRADFCLSIGGAADQAAFNKTWASQIKTPRLQGEIKPLQTGMHWPALRVFAFAGIAHPDKFFQTLTDLGADVVGSEGLSDHEPLSQTLLNRLLARADGLRAQLVCTEKDAARIPASFLPNILVLPVRLVVQDWSQIDAAFADLGL